MKMKTEEGNLLMIRFMGLKIKALKEAYNYEYEHWTPNGKKQIDVFFGKLKEDEIAFDNLIQQCIVPQLKFDSDYEWLIPVVEKIDKLVIDNFPIIVSMGAEGIYIGYNHSNAAGQEKTGRLEIISTLNINNFIHNDADKYSMRQSIWQGVAGFLAWYFKHKNS